MSLGKVRQLTDEEATELRVLMQMLLSVLRVCPYSLTIQGTALQSLFFNFVVEQLKRDGDDVMRARIRLAGDRLHKLAEAPIEDLEHWVKMLSDSDVGSTH